MRAGDAYRDGGVWCTPSGTKTLDGGWCFGQLGGGNTQLTEVSGDDEEQDARRTKRDEVRIAVRRTPTILRVEDGRVSRGVYSHALVGNRFVKVVI